MKNWILVWFTLSMSSLLAQPAFNSRDLSVSPFIDGTIYTPKDIEKPKLAILIAGSGPLDRDGNQQMSRTNYVKFLAAELSKQGIATFRYDKRVVKQMRDRTIREESIRFDEFIQDAKDVFLYFQRANAFSEIYIIGHSQGSLIGMMAAQLGADGFISLAGAGQVIDNVIVHQLGKQAPGLQENARQAFDEMRANGTTANYSPGLISIFRPSIQPFMLSWMKYDPQQEIAKLDVPTLIINGDRDLQIPVSEAEKLLAAKSDSKYQIIQNMNHILKAVGEDDVDVGKSYNDPSMPVIPELVTAIVSFIITEK